MYVIFVDKKCVGVSKYLRNVSDLLNDINRDIMILYTKSDLEKMVFLVKNDTKGDNPKDKQIKTVFEVCDAWTYCDKYLELAIEISKGDIKKIIDTENTFYKI
jgi:hypothetical protein